MHCDRNSPIGELGQLEMIGYAYDNFGRPNLLSRRNARQSLLEYDPISRPNVLINTSFGSAADVRFDYGYNPASQIVTQARSNDSYAFTAITAANKTYSINGLNQYTNVAGSTHTYDASGNLTGDGVNTYVYDGENRLVSATAAGVTTTLTYDPLGRLWRIQKGAADTRLLYDGDALIGEYDGAGSLTKRYVHGSNAVADDPLVDYVGATLSSRRFLETDHQGSIILIADNAGATVGTNRYDEYGVPQSTNQGRFQYTGQAWLTELGLYYYKARFYSATLGRFLQTDPVGYEDQINLYAYAENDPLNLFDPSGLCTGSAFAECTGLSVAISEIGIEHAAFQQPSAASQPSQATSQTGQASERTRDRSTLTDTQVANIVFNETRSLSGEGTEDARRNIAHAIINGDRELGSRRPITAPTTARVSEAERGTYESSQKAVIWARIEQKIGIDPTRGAMNFNLRANPSTNPFYGLGMTTQTGPLQNSYPTKILPSTGIYVNTYGEVKRR